MRTTLLLDLTADSCGDRAAIGPLASAIDFARLQRGARSAGAEFARSGARTVVFIGLNGAAMPLALFAAGYAGMPFAPLNYRLADRELRRLVERCAPAVAVVDAEIAPRLAGVQGVTVLLRDEFEERFLATALPAIAELGEPDDDIAVLLFTSGTTGEPKAAILRHANLVGYVMGTVEFLGSDPEEAALVSVPPYHIAGISAVLTSAYSGRRIVYLPQFDADAWASTAADERITHAMVVPTMLDRILDALERRNETLPHLKALSYGGGRMPEATILRAMERLPHVGFVNAYGLTETSSTIALLDADDHRAAYAASDPAVRRRLASVGRPLPTVELEIRDPHGNPCAPGKAGEICVRGEQVSGEYIGRHAGENDGWFATKDSGWLDENGYLYVEGRLDDVIVRGGENISPGEIEDVLRGHPAVADVAVVGLPCDRWGEKVAAAVVVREGEVSEAALADHVRQRLRSTKTPEAWFFRSDLPYNETGKLLRRVLRNELA